jgi:hypothetical protein
LNQAFPASQEFYLARKKFGLDVWAKVVQHHFKYHLPYSTIQGLMMDDWGVEISQGTIRAICEFFEVSGKHHVDSETKALVAASGRIVLSLDGAQPKKGRAALWVFADRITGRVLLTRFLDTASHEVLLDLFNEIEELYGVPIIAVISDKQRNIVNAVKAFRTSIRHAYCQYHFLNHVRKPIAAKDSHLLKSLRKEVRAFSIVANRPANPVTSISPSSPVHDVFDPLAQELLCAIATRGDRFKVFPGLEAYQNLSFLRGKLKDLDGIAMNARMKRSFNALCTALERMVGDHESLAREITALSMDFNTLRVRLGKRSKTGKQVKKNVDKWVYMLASRLKRRDLERDPLKIKWKQPTHSMSLQTTWQQWIRLVGAYEEGLYEAYDDPFLEHTNNAMESFFSIEKHHFRSIFGKDDINEQFEVHADYQARLVNFDFNPRHVREVLLARETALVDAERHDLHARYVTTRRRWRIREEETGNLARFEHWLKSSSNPG